MPEWGRFLNADVYVDTEQGMFSCNMYAYCENDPVNSSDPSGMKLFDVTVIFSITRSGKSRECQLYLRWESIHLYSRWSFRSLTIWNGKFLSPKTYKSLGATTKAGDVGRNGTVFICFFLYQLMSTKYIFLAAVLWGITYQNLCGYQ